MHRLAADLGNSWRDPEIYNEYWTQRTKTLISRFVALLMPSLSSMLKDDCELFCSETGCTLIHSLLSMTAPRYLILQYCQVSGPHGIWRGREMALSYWTDCCPACEEQDFRRRVTCRFEISLGLGMHHTCCKFKRSRVAGFLAAKPYMYSLFQPDCLHAQ